MNLRVDKCTATKNSIAITFSEAVNVLSDTDASSATNPANYSVFDPNSQDFTEATNLKDAGAIVPPISPSTTTVANDTVIIKLAPTDGSQIEFQPGDIVLITISGVKSAGGDSLHNGPITRTPKVPGIPQVARTTKDVEDAISYPILTEEIGYRPSPVGIQTGGGQGSGVSNLGQVAAKAVSDVLGWKPSATDPKGFIGALTQAFTLSDVEGHVESKWTPRTYAVQTDLGGGITGAQASLYTRAKNALDSVLPLLDGLYPLDPEADPEYVRSLREMARSQMSEIVKEFGVVGLPSILRIDTYFEILVGQNPAHAGHHVQFDPDSIKGTLGELRDTFGIGFVGNKFNNSIEDEQDITNFRVISDYITSLMQSWIANREFFRLGTKKPAFFGTQLVLISRQFTVIAETVNEVRFALDSVFIGPNERQSLLLEFMDHKFAPMFLEDVLEEIENFVANEGPRLLKDGGKISVTNNILPVVRTLKHLVEQAHEPKNINILPDGFKTSRVRNSLDDLQDQLKALISLIVQVEQQVPLPEDELLITDIVTGLSTENYISILGNGFDNTSTAIFRSTAAIRSTAKFYSAQRIDVLKPPIASNERHTVTVTNDDGRSVTQEFYYSNGAYTLLPAAKRVPVSVSLGDEAGTTTGGAGAAISGTATAGTSANTGQPISIQDLNTKVDAMFKALLDGQTAAQAQTAAWQTKQKAQLDSMHFSINAQATRIKDVTEKFASGLGELEDQINDLKDKASKTHESKTKERHHG